ncbi:Severe Depolymerization of Actin, partial [Linderina macrospora]
MTAVQFFLNPIKKKSKDDDDSDDDGDVDNSTASRKYVPLSMVQHQSNVTKKTKYRKRKLERIEREYKREQAKRTGAYYDDEAEDDKKKNKKKLPVVNFEAISLIHDPQGFTEKLFGKVHAATTATKRGGSTVDRFEVRLAILKLVSRMINHHQLQLMAFYPFFQRYLQPHQTEVTQILAILATACHPFTPPDVLQPLIRATADNFVADHCAPEVMCAGLNTIRAIASRQPLAVDADLLNDLIMYRKHKDKGVMMAARSLLALYRSVNPEMLNRKDRGRDASMEEGVNIMAAFGEARPAEGVEGAELLDMYENPESEDENESDVEQEAGWEQFEAATDSEAEDEEEGEDGEGWTNADEDEDAEIEVESSDEEAEGEGEEVDEGDSDEEAEEADEEEFEEEVVPAKTETKRPRIEMTRFLTNEDFDRIEKLKRRQKKGTLTAPKRVKTDDYSDDDDEEDLQLSDS